MANHLQCNAVRIKDISVMHSLCEVVLFVKWAYWGERQEFLPATNTMLHEKMKTSYWVKMC